MLQAFSLRIEATYDGEKEKYTYKIDTYNSELPEGEQESQRSGEFTDYEEFQNAIFNSMGEAYHQSKINLLTD